VKFYAQLNNDNVCVGVSILAGEVTADNMVEIPNADEDFIYRKFDGQWSVAKYQPDVPLIKKDEFEELKAQQALMQAALDELIFSGGVL
jgi:hypothetical protein